MLFLALLIVMTRPSWHTLSHKVVNLGDPVLFGWSWNWTRHAIVNAPSQLFQGNIYWHHDLTIAYTDNMLLLLLPFSALRALGASWALELNLISLGLIYGSLVTTYSFVHRLTQRIDTSVFAAAAYTFGGYTFAHQGHIQLLLIGQFPLGFLLAYRWLERRRMRDAIGFGLINASFFLGSLYYAAIWTVCVAVIVLGTIGFTRFRPGRWFWTGLPVVGAFTAFAVPVMIPYLTLAEERPLVPEWGLDVRDFFVVAQNNIVYRGLDHWAATFPARGEHTFFPGFTTMALAAVGIVAVLWAGLAAGSRLGSRLGALFPAARRREIWLLVGAGAVAIVLSFGPLISGRRAPFAWFHDSVPGFAGIRVAARLAVPGMLALAVLAAIGLTAATQMLRPRTGAIIAVILTGFLLFELATPVTYIRLPDDRRTLAVYRALEKRPRGAVAELPIQSPIESLAWASVEAPRMLYSTLDLHPRVNGYSGSWPDNYFERKDVFNQFPAPIALTAARALDVRYFILHEGWYEGFPQYRTEEIAVILASLPPTAHASHFGSAWLVDLGPRP